MLNLEEEKIGTAINDPKKSLMKLIEREDFKHQNGKTAIERCAQAYSSLIQLGKQSEITETDILECRDNLLELHEWTGFVSGTVLTIMTIHYNLCLGTIIANQHPNHSVKDIINKLLDFDSVGVFLATELEYGNNVIKLKTTAIFNPETRTYTIHTPCAEAKKFMPNTAYSGVPKIACVLARLNVNGKDEGVYPFIVPLHAIDGSPLPGINITPLGEKPGYDLDNAITWFDTVEIPERFGLLGKNASFNKKGVFVCTVGNLNRRFHQSINRAQAGKLCLSGGIANGLKSVLKIAFSYADQRNTFGTGKKDIPIGEYAAHKIDLIKALVNTYAIDALYQSAKAIPTYDFNSAQQQFDLAILKAYVSNTALNIVNTLRQRIGAQGMLRESGIIDHIISLHGVITAEGDNLVIREKAAQSLIMKKDFSSLIPETDSMQEVEIKEIILNTDIQRKLMSKVFFSRRARTYKALKKYSAYQNRLESWNSISEDASQCLDAYINYALLNALNVYFGEDKNILHCFTLYCLEQCAIDLVELEIISAEDIHEIRKSRLELVNKIYTDRQYYLQQMNIPDSAIHSPIISNYMDYYNRLSGYLPSHKAQEGA